MGNCVRGIRGGAVRLMVMATMILMMIVIVVMIMREGWAFGK